MDAGQIRYHVAMTRNNAAQSLLDAIEFLKARPNAQLGETWSAMLGIAQSHTPSLLRGVATLVELPDRALAQLRAIEGADYEHLATWRSEVRACLSHAFLLTSATNQAAAQVGVVAMFSLQGCARAIDRAPGGRDIDDDGIADARRVVQNLIEALEACDLEADAKATLIRHASAIAHALNIIRYTGAEGVDDALAAALGAAFFTARAHPGTSSSPAFANFMQVIEVVAAVVTVWTGTSQITAGVVDVLNQISM